MPYSLVIEMRVQYLKPTSVPPGNRKSWAYQFDLDRSFLI